MKVCIICHTSKEDSEFRLTKKYYKDKTYEALDCYCKPCRTTYSRERKNRPEYKECQKLYKQRPDVKEKSRLNAKQYYNEHKDIEAFREKNRIRSRENLKKFAPKIRKRLEFKRGTPEWKEYMRKWHESHRDQDRKLAKNRYEKYISELTPTYVKGVIAASFHKQGISVSYEEITDEMVEIKIKQLKSCRTQRKLNSLSKNQ